MKFIGQNSMRINREVVEHAILCWLNDGIFDGEKQLVIKKFERHLDGGMTLIFQTRKEDRAAKERAERNTPNGK